MHLATCWTFGAANAPFIVTTAHVSGLPVSLSSLIAQSLPLDRGGEGWAQVKVGGVNESKIKSLFSPV